MRVLMISGSFSPIICGISDVVDIVAHRLARHADMRVGVLTGRQAEIHRNDPDIDVMPVIDTWGFASLPKIIRTVKAWNPDIIHIEFPTAGYGRCKMPVFLPLVFRLMGLSCIQRWHEPIAGFRCLRYLPAAVAPDFLVVVEPDYFAMIPAWFRQTLTMSKKDIRYIPVGSNIPAAQLDQHERELVRARYGGIGKRLLAYFGFAIPSKGLEMLFEVADPDTDLLLLICELDEHNDYQRKILEIVRSPRWQQNVIVTGYLDAPEVSRLLATADAAVFPFITGVTRRNASVLAARTQKTFVLTTSFKQNGYSTQDHVYYARPGNIPEMRQALADYAEIETPSDIMLPAGWDYITEEHIRLYEDVMKSLNNNQ